MSSLKGFGSTLASADLVAGPDRQIDDRVPGALVRRSLHGDSKHSGEVSLNAFPTQARCARRRRPSAGLTNGVDVQFGEPDRSPSGADLLVTFKWAPGTSLMFAAAAVLRGYSTLAVVTDSRGVAQYAQPPKRIFVGNLK